MPKPPKFLDLAVMAIEAHQRPMGCAEMVHWANRKGLLTTKGKTPEKTMYASVIRSIRGDLHTPFVRTKDGLFALRFGIKG
jgi:hypothetical protein